MSALQSFTFGHCHVRTAGTHEAPLFCAADVCDVLGVQNVSQACSQLDAEDLESVQHTIGRKPATFVTESGLYALIFASRKPEAKAFKRWVTAEVLPAIRKQGYYSALEAQQQKTTAELLAACFPSAPAKAKPIFGELISALLKMRNEPLVGNPPWAPLLASLIYGYAIPVEGQQQKRRALNAKPDGSHVDHAMFAPEVKAHVLEVAHAGVALAKNSNSWNEWRARMDTAFHDAPLQLSLLTPVRRLPPKKAG